MMSVQSAWGLARVFGPALIAIVFLGLWQASLRQRARVSADLEVARVEVKQRDAIIATDRASYRAAIVIAERRNAARIVTIEARNLASKKEADRAYTIDLARGQRLAAAYIADNRVQPNAATASPAATVGGRAGVGTVAQGPAVAAKPNGPGSLTVLASPEDINICTINSVRLQNAVDWARGITETGR